MNVVSFRPTISGNSIYLDYRNANDSAPQQVTQELTLGNNGNIVSNKLVFAGTSYWTNEISTSHGKGLVQGYNNKYTIYLSDSNSLVSFSDEKREIPSSQRTFADLNNSAIFSAIPTSSLFLSTKGIEKFNINEYQPLYDENGKVVVTEERSGFCIEQAHNGGIYSCSSPNSSTHYVQMFDSNLKASSQKVNLGLKSVNAVTSTETELHFWSIVEFKKQQSLRLVKVNKIKSTSAHSMKKDISDNPVHVSINGNNLSFEQPPVIMNGKTMVPMRKIFESLQATIKWDDENRIVSGTKGNVTVTLQIDSPVAKVNNSYIQLEQAATIINGSTMVPVRFISEALGAKVGWDAKTSTVLIETSN